MLAELALGLLLVGRLEEGGVGVREVPVVLALQARHLVERAERLDPLTGGHVGQLLGHLVQQSLVLLVPEHLLPAEEGELHLLQILGELAAVERSLLPQLVGAPHLLGPLREVVSELPAVFGAEARALLLEVAHGLLHLRQGGDRVPIPQGMVGLRHLGVGASRSLQVGQIQMGELRHVGAVLLAERLLLRGGRLVGLEVRGVRVCVLGGHPWFTFASGCTVV
jgi:hypothetical protein